MNPDLLPVLGAVSLAGVATVALVGIEARESATRRRTWQTVELRFGRALTPESVLLAVDRLAGLHRGSLAVLDLVADHEGITHFLSAEQSTIDTLRGSLRAIAPSMRLLPAPTLDTSNFRFGRRVRLGGRLKTLRSNGVGETAGGLLAAVQPLSEKERLVLRWWIGPGLAAPVPRVEADQMVEPEDRRRLRLKNEGSIAAASAVVAVTSINKKRAAHVLGRVTAVLRTRNNPYGQLRFRPVTGAALRRSLGRQSLPLGRSRFASSELAGLIGWPVDGPVLPGLSLGTAPQLIPSSSLPRTGRVIGSATWPGAERPIAQPVVGAMSHSLIAGPTGVGKSTLLTSLIGGDIAAGRGVVVIDGKGDTAAAVLARVPERRLGDVVVLDCASDGPLPGLKLFGYGDPELAADVVLGVLSDLFRDSWGPLSERYLRAGLVAVAHDPKGTLADVPFVFTDPAYRRRLVGRLSDPLTKATFAGYEAMSAAERQHQLAAPLGKLGTLLGRPVVRTVLGQVKPQLDFHTALRKNQIVVISLAPARVGAPAARLIGALSVFALFQAVQGRASLPERLRTPFLVSIDEPRALGDLPMPLDALLEQARGLGVGLTLAPQSMAQLPKAVREAALTNVATRIVFRQDADDARLLARDLRDVTPEDLGDLPAFEAVARIGLGPGSLAPPVTIRTAPPTRALRDPSVIRKQSADRFGQSLADVDAALQSRHQPVGKDAPVGRRRRQA